jgi:hypothetical protein
MDETKVVAHYYPEYRDRYQVLDRDMIFVQFFVNTPAGFFASKFMNGTELCCFTTMAPTYVSEVRPLSLSGPGCRYELCHCPRATNRIWIIWCLAPGRIMDCFRNGNLKRPRLHERLSSYKVLKPVGSLDI